MQPDFFSIYTDELEMRTSSMFRRYSYENAQDM